MSKVLGKLLPHLSVNPPSVFYNIGVGLHKDEAWWMKKQFPSVEIHGVEPNRVSWRARKEQNYPGHLFNYGISFQEQRELLIDSNPDNSSFYAEGGEKALVNCITLDEFDRRSGRPEGSIFLWIDIEGSEVEALLSGHKLMSSGRVKFVNIELHTTLNTPWKHFNFHALPGILKGYGYGKVLEYNDQRSHHDELWRLKNE